VNLWGILSHPLLIATGPAVVAAVAAWLVRRNEVEVLRRALEAKSKALEGETARVASLVAAGRTSALPAEQAVARQQEAVSALNDLLDASRAERATLYAPLDDTEGNYLGLIVLATAPTNLAKQVFDGQVFSTRDARAVQCFLSREPVASEATAFRFDGVTPSSTYADCLMPSAAERRDSPLGVVQLLNVGETRIDRGRAHAAIEREAERLAEVARSFIGAGQRNLEQVGLRMPVNSRRGAVLVFDMSHSAALLMQDFRSATVIELMQRIASAVQRATAAHGAVFEGFTGDGFVFAFLHGDDAAGEAFVVRALRAAEGAIAGFQEAMKDFRADLRTNELGVRGRVGIATGIVHPITLAQAHMRLTSVFGRTPSVAKIVCDCAPRERDVVALDAATWLELPAREQHAFAPLKAALRTPKAIDRNIQVYLWRT
jgi:class 3 adenylate cyclase